ncbi:MAG: outer membrane lipoprotein carrier protein LolA [Rhodospirillaceae bacterium]|nr:outer membrane lipoprotein carrier protein LolA [Rhodospirillaceae bacterium]MBT5242960.1 outer membrane lipoprotein carrier protein LolA [Rhodospirillaceae bacterium]MBT6243499.1 outer membrane lipoprotein carrier protein LolA [Rhodospirillaceae bacterium]MBT7137530.1 outer membrane lipoprotein carrier protein LolA [Rhodospirillaceae bacterium]
MSAVAKSLSGKSAKPSYKSLFLKSFAVVLLTLSLAGKAPAEVAPLALKGADKSDVLRVQKYLNGLITLKSRFLQASSTGNFAEGTFYLSRPGKMRIEYDPPVQFLIVADGTWLIYHDKELEQITHIPLGTTPADILVQENLSLLAGELIVTKIERGPGIIGVTLVREEDDGGQLTLIFSDKPLQLKKWIVLDPQGIKTSVSLLSTQRDVSFDPKLFNVKLKHGTWTPGDK